MKTKNVYVWISSWDRGRSWESASAPTRAMAKYAREADRRLDWLVSPIVKVAVPLPEVKP